MTRKRDDKGRFVSGTSGNPKGRPKDGQSWSAIISEIGEMTPEEILEWIPNNNDLGQFVAQLPKSVQMKYLVIMRAYSALMFEPSTTMLKEFMDRLEGKVTDNLKISGDKNSPLTVVNWDRDAGDDQD